MCKVFFFRAETQRKALEFGLTGWVKNLPDRTVELVACGTQELLEPFIAWLHEGPPRASVTRVSVDDHPLQDYTEFKVIR